METVPLPKASVRRVDRQFAAWERLRRRLVEREAAWALAVAAQADRRRLARLQHDIERLRLELAEGFERAMDTLEDALGQQSAPQ